MIVEFLKSIFKRINGEVATSTLVKRGMIVGKDFVRQQGCYIDPSHCFLIEIGNNVTLSIRVTLMAHDASTKIILGYTKIGSIKIGNNVFIGANSTVLPNVRIGDNVVVGANSVITRDVPSNSVVAGNPGKVISSIADFEEKNKERMKNASVFSKEYRYSASLSDDKIIEMKKATVDSTAFID